MAGYTYETRREARKARQAGEVVVKVEGGYTLFTCEYYKVWKKNAHC